MRKPYRLLDLFSGIGGFSLGLERTGGFKTVAFCEIDPFCRKALRKHWPEVPQYDDVRTLTAEKLAADGIAVDTICGGFPCQDISLAGAGAGIEGERSGLWAEYARIVGELRPRYVIVENVAALLGRGLDRVLGDLATLGYDAEWHCIPASAVGAPHRRDRLWIIAYADSDDGRSRRPRRLASGSEGQSKPERTLSVMADASCGRCDRARNGEVELAGRAETVGPGETLADAISERCGKAWSGPRWGGFAWGGQAIFREWDAEPHVGRVAHGVPDRVDRLRALGNAVVPQIPELIGRAILAAEAAAE